MSMSIICVDRPIRPPYPGWAKVMHPDLETVGPREYDLARVELYLHDGQKGRKTIQGYKLYEHLKKNDRLRGCLGLQDALAIQSKGIATFRKFFGGNVVYCWKSVLGENCGNTIYVAYRSSDLYVPYFCGRGDRVKVGCFHLGHGLHSRDPAARFAS